jgi:hypothetical protein
MAGNFLYRPPTNRRFDPITGEEVGLSEEDEAVFQRMGAKYSEILFNQPVRTVLGRSSPPRSGAIWGVMIDWAFDHLGVFSWVPEMGSYAPFCDYDKDGRASQLELLRWNDEKMGGKIFKDWQIYDHPQLGKVEIGGFIRKLFNAEFNSYTSLMCFPGNTYEEYLDRHTQWNLYLVSQAPLIRIARLSAESEGSGFYKINLSVRNKGQLPTNVSRQAVINKTAKPVRAELSLGGARLVMGKKTLSLGHIPADDIHNCEWMIKKTGTQDTEVMVRVFSEKGGTDLKKITLK